MLTMEGICFLVQMGEESWHLCEGINITIHDSIAAFCVVISNSIFVEMR